MERDRLDLNLFRFFDAILRQKTVAGAARELDLSASAVSHALARLRALLGDELFLHGQGGMVPTPLAAKIAPDICSALVLLETAVDTSPFDPLRSEHVFHIGASDGVSAVVLPPLLRHIAKAAPGLRIRIVPVGRLDIAQQLDEGRLDLVLGWFDTLPERINRLVVYEEHEALVVRHDHPLTRLVLTPKLLLSYPHLVVDFTGTEALPAGGFFLDRGVHRRTWLERLVADNLEPAKIERRVTITLPGYGAVVPVVAVTDMIATVPARMARQAAVQGEIAILDLPYEPLMVPVEAAWHTRNSHDRGVRWLVETMRALLEDAAPE